MDSHLAALLLQYRWEILIPLSFVESPIVAFISGTLASLGYFNVFALGGYFFVKDILFDAAFYYTGYHGVHRPFVQRLLKKVGVTEEHFGDIKEKWERHPGWTMFIGKVSYGIAMGFIVAAGAVRMSLRKFFAWGAVAAVLQYWSLIAVGYFFGASFGSLGGIISNLEWVAGVGGLLFSGYLILAWYLRRRALKKHELS
jgi:membrane protein DedA with SNARE-associated domain